MSVYSTNFLYLRWKLSAGILVLDILCWISILSRFCFGRTVLGVLCWACLYMLHSVGQWKIYSVGHLNNGLCWTIQIPWWNFPQQWKELDINWRKESVGHWLRDGKCWTVKNCYWYLRAHCQCFHLIYLGEQLIWHFSLQVLLYIVEEEIAITWNSLVK